jgi:dolichol-phosphate mannosyltransferase
MKCSLVIACYNEEHNVVPLHSAICEVIGDDPDWELLFVDDGSVDATLDRIKEVRSRDGRVRYISLLRNYGHQKALLAGLHHCVSDVAITMDADLQHPPRYIPKFMESQRETRAHVVVGRRVGRQRGLLKELFSRTFYKVFSWLTDVTVIPGASDFRLYTQRALEVLRLVREREPFLRGMVPSLGLPLTILDYELDPRHGDSPSYSFRKSARMGLGALLRFSDVPVKIGFLVGTLGILLSSAQAIHYLYLRLFTEKLVPGQADLMVFLGLISSIMILLLSLLIRMVRESHDYLRRQPVYLVAEMELEREVKSGPPTIAE